jgi:alkanesulfonate monooxygenase SsuD/methylene tetrahydromethanopterin reductase-like flavin-dependent oxidoreductase (luciferase family)
MLTCTRLPRAEALYGTPHEIGDKLQALREAGGTGKTETLRRFTRG